MQAAVVKAEPLPTPAEDGSVAEHSGMPGEDPVDDAEVNQALADADAAVASTKSMADAGSATEPAADADVTDADSPPEQADATPSAIDDGSEQSANVSEQGAAAQQPLAGAGDDPAAPEETDAHVTETDPAVVLPGDRAAPAKVKATAARSVGYPSAPSEEEDVSPAGPVTDLAAEDPADEVVASAAALPAPETATADAVMDDGRAVDCVDKESQVEIDRVAQEEVSHAEVEASTRAVAGAAAKKRQAEQDAKRLMEDAAQYSRQAAALRRQAEKAAVSAARLAAQKYRQEHLQKAAQLQHQSDAKAKQAEAIRAAAEAEVNQAMQRLGSTPDLALIQQASRIQRIRAPPCSS